MIREARRPAIMRRSGDGELSSNHGACCNNKMELNMPVTAETTTVSDASLDDVVAAAQDAANAPAAPAPRKLLPEPAVQHFRKAGLIDNDEDQTALTILKRVNHFLRANQTIGKIPELQRGLREELEKVNGDIAQLTIGGADSKVAKFVDDCLAELAAHYKKSFDELTALPQPLMGTFELAEVKKRAWEKYVKYDGERAPYKGMPSLINDIVAKYPQLFKKYKRLDELALESGIVKGPTEKMRDELDDVGAEIIAVRLFNLASSVLSIPKETLPEQKKFPESFKTNIILAAEDTALHNTGLERITLFDNSENTPEVRQLLALSELGGAYLHALTSHNRSSNGDPANRTLQELADNVALIPGIVAKLRMAGGSLAHAFLNEGEGADDARMKSVDASLVQLANDAHIPIVPAEEARRNAQEIVDEAANYLRTRFAGNPEQLTKIDTLVAEATGKFAEKSFAAGLTPPSDTTFAADAAASKGTSPAL
jgi:hypothetical protein